MKNIERQYWKINFPQSQVYRKLIEHGRVIINNGYFFPSAMSRITKDNFLTIRKGDCILFKTGKETISIYSVNSEPSLTDKAPIEFIREFGEEDCKGDYLICNMLAIKENISVFDLRSKDLEWHLNARYSIRNITTFADVIEKAITDKTVWTADSILFEQLSKTDNLTDYIHKNNPIFYKYDFVSYLNKLKEERHLTIAQISKRSGVGNYVYKIFSGEKSPSREVLICIGIGMSLTVDEMQTLLKYSRLALLDPKVKRDAIVIFGLYHNLTFEEINSLIYEYNEDTFFEN